MEPTPPTRRSDYKDWRADTYMIYAKTTEEATGLNRIQNEMIKAAAPPWSKFLAAIWRAYWRIGTLLKMDQLKAYPITQAGRIELSSGLQTDCSPQSRTENNRTHAGLSYKEKLSIKRNEIRLQSTSQYRSGHRTAQRLYKDEEKCLDIRSEGSIRLQTTQPHPHTSKPEHDAVAFCRYW